MWKNTALEEWQKHWHPTGKLVTITSVAAGPQAGQQTPVHHWQTGNSSFTASEQLCWKCTKSASRRDSTFLHHVMLHPYRITNCLSISMCTVIQLIRGFSKVLSPRGKHWEYELLTMVLIHTFPQVTFFLLFVKTLFSIPLEVSILKLYFPFLSHFLDKSHKWSL